MILVDDGSANGICGNLCGVYSLEYLDLIISIHTKNGGLEAARNAGVKHTKGQYLLFSDSDDYIKGGYLDTVRAVALRFKCDIIQIGYQIEEKGQIAR